MMMSAVSDKLAYKQSVMPLRQRLSTIWARPSPSIGVIRSSLHYWAVPLMMSYTTHCGAGAMNPTHLKSTRLRASKRASQGNCTRKRGNNPHRGLFPALCLGVADLNNFKLTHTTGGLHLGDITLGLANQGPRDRAQHCNFALTDI